MTADTRSEFLRVATRQFAEKGFYGTSLASIADDVGLTKQALIHHFGTKEKLYGEVLQGISDRLLGNILRAGGRATVPREQLEAVVVSCFAEAERRAEDLALLMRELLDNKRRAERASNWYLKPYLVTLIAMVRRVDGWEEASESQALALVYQLLGAVNYFAVSTPTLTQMFGKRQMRALSEEFPVRLRALVQASLGHPPSVPTRLNHEP